MSDTPERLTPEQIIEELRRVYPHAKMPLCQEAADTLATLFRERDEAIKHLEKFNHWRRRAQKAEAELCVTAEERARQGMSIGRGLAGATWHHYKDRAEAAERERDEARQAEPLHSPECPYAPYADAYEAPEGVECTCPVETLASRWKARWVIQRGETRKLEAQLKCQHDEIMTLRAALKNWNV